MKVRTRVVLVLAMIAALLVAVPGVGAQEPAQKDDPHEEVLPGEEPLIELTGDEVEALIESDMGAWLSFRQKMGFAGDETVVADLVRTLEGQLGMDAWSIPLSFEERAEMDERTLATSNSGEVRPVLERMDGYADMYIDHQQQGTVVVNFSRKLTSREEEEIRSLFALPSRVGFRIVEHSLSDLQEIVQAVENQRQELPGLTSLAISPEDNTVLVGVAEPGVTTAQNPEASPGFLEAVTDNVKLKVRESLGSAEQGDIDSMIATRVFPILKPTGCYGRENCATTSSENWRGGTGLDLGQSGAYGSYECTSGFIFTDGAVRLLSANGHCDNFAVRNVAIAGQASTGGSLDKFVSNSLITDWPVVNSADYNLNVDSDAAMIIIHPNRSDNRVYKSYQKKNWFINDRNDNLMVNDATCVSGVTTGWRCGTVEPFLSSPAETGPLVPNTNLTYFVENLHVVMMEFVWPGAHTTTGGNSGSPVFAGRAAHGLYFGEASLTVVGSPSNPDTEVIAAYSTIQGIEDELGVELCTAAADC